MQTSTVPLPRIANFESLAYGLFLHWGLYSLSRRGEWTQRWHRLPPDAYRERARSFSAEAFDARSIAALARECGMRYIVLTTRHHEGFSLYDTCGLNEFDAPHSAAGRDLVREFVDGCRAEGITPFFYHTTLDWSQNTEQCSDEAFRHYQVYLRKSIELLCTHYGEIGGFWFDGNWSRPGADWEEDALYRIIRERQPEAVIINNSSVNALGVEGHPELDAVTYEQGIPAAERAQTGKYLAAEMCQTFNLHWGIADQDLLLKSPAELIQTLATCRQAGANLLMNVGPEPSGALPAYEVAALRKVAEWIRLHADAVYDSRPGEGGLLHHHDGFRAFAFVRDLNVQDNSHETRKAGAVDGPRHFAPVTRRVREVRWMDEPGPVDFDQNLDTGRLTVDCTPYPYGRHLVVRVAEITFA